MRKIIRFSQFTFIGYHFHDIKAKFADFLQKKREKNVKCENYVAFTSDKCQNINLFKDPYQSKFLKFSVSLFVLTAMHFALVTLNNI